MIRIVCVCGAGVATGPLLKYNLETALNKLGIEAGKYTLDITNVNLSFGYDADVYFAWPLYAQELEAYAKANNKKWIIWSVKNINDTKELEEKLSKSLKQLKQMGRL